MAKRVKFARIFDYGSLSFIGIARYLAETFGNECIIYMTLAGQFHSNRNSWQCLGSLLGKHHFFRGRKLGIGRVDH